MEFISKPQKRLVLSNQPFLVDSKKNNHFRLIFEKQPFLVDFWSNSYIFAGDYNKQRVWIK